MFKGGCNVPFGGHATIAAAGSENGAGGPRLHLVGRALSTDGTRIVEGARFRGDGGGDNETQPASALAKKPLSGSWTNKAGKAIKADLLRLEEDKAVLRLPNGRIYKYPLSDLSAESAEKARQFGAGS